ncbi:MAG TPA: septum formation initiator family protein [Anaeromyxobacter sp.]
MSWKGRRARWRVLVLGAVVAAAAAAAFDPSGLRRYLALSSEVRRMQRENARLASDNAALSREVRALRSDPAALERAAREELRFVRPGERVYWLGAGNGAAP